MKKELKLKIATFLGYNFLNFVCRRIKWKVVGEENFKRFKEKKERAIFAVWHGRMFIPMYYLKGEEIYGIVSPSQDGEYFARIFSKFGYKTIRGSTGRKSISAVISAIKILKEEKFIAITPDGPRGPKEKVQPGVIYLASKTATPIIPTGATCKYKKFLNTWDNSLLPLPGGVGVIVFGEPVYIPGNLEMDMIEYYAEILEKELKKVNQIAEEMVK